LTWVELRELNAFSMRTPGGEVVPGVAQVSASGHASITTTLDLSGHLYPGEMDRYADRLDEAAVITGTAKMRPADADGLFSEEGPTR
jgi:hypothetical protein